MTLEKLLSNLEAIEAEGNGDLKLSNDFGYLFTGGYRDLNFSEQALFDTSHLGLHAYDLPTYSVSQFAEKVRFFIDQIKGSENKAVLINGKSILDLDEKDGLIVPVTTSSIDLDDFINNLIEQGSNWLKMFFEMGVSVRELCGSAYKCDYAEYIKLRCAGNHAISYAIAGILKTEVARKEVFLEAIDEYLKSI